MRNFAIVSFVLVIFAGASEGANDGRCREAMAIGLASTQCTTEISQTDKNTKTQLRHYLERLESFGFSGQVLVVDKGHIVVHSGYGGARRDPFKAVSVNTVFDIASLTKQFTAAAILSLEMDGKLKTSDPISKYLDSVPIDKAAITVQQLITHMSGLRRDLVQNATIDFVSRDELIKRTLESKLLAEPGKNFIYSNAGYHLLAAIIEKLSGQSFFNYLNYKLFEPAGMRSTFSQTDRRKKPLAAYPNNEWRELSEYVDRPESWHLFGPSGISSTAGDIRKWTQAIMTNKIFTNEARDKFLARQAPLEEGVFYGCGWFVEKAKNGGDLISSGGDVAGYHSEFRWERQTDRLIIVLTNQDVFGLSGGAVQKRIIADNVSRLLDGETFSEPPPAGMVPSNLLSKYEGSYSLQSGGMLKIWRVGNVLKIGAEGQDAIDILLGADADLAKTLEKKNQLALKIFDSIKNGDLTNLKGIFSEDEYNIYISAIVKQFPVNASGTNLLFTTRVLGTIPFPYDKGFARTYVKGQFENDKFNVFLGWNTTAINDITFGEGKPAPIILPLARLGGNEFSTFDLFSSKAVRLTFIPGEESSVSGLTLSVNGQQIGARKT